MAAEKMSQLKLLQVGNARKLVLVLQQVAVEQKLPDMDAWLMYLGGLTTANAESTFQRYGNDGTYAGLQKESVWGWYGGQEAYRKHLRISMTENPDAMGGSAETTKDSIGLYQQREMYGYAGLGSKPNASAPGRLMSIEWTTRVWALGVPSTPSSPSRWWLHPKTPEALKGVDDLSVAKRCQWVQGSEFPDGGNYLEAIPVARELLVAFELPAPTVDWFTECFQGVSE